MSGIFALVCPDCGVPFEDHPESAASGTNDVSDRTPDDGVADAADVAADDVNVCVECACAFVVRFGYAFAVAHPSDRGAA